VGTSTVTPEVDFGQFYTRTVKIHKHRYFAANNSALYEIMDARFTAGIRKEIELSVIE
jgi:hypothetical protein